MVWAIAQYSKNAVLRAGETLIDPDATHEERSQAMDVLSNWRAAHAYPMHSLLMMLRQKSSKIDGRAVVVQRLKRAPSIIEKLSRYPQMKLHRMQDISGCRAIVSTVRDVERLSDRITASRTRHTLHRVDDYIKVPKDTGYRGIHLVYKYNGEKTAYQDYFVELQLRSKIQHAWATAVEIVDTFTNQALKASSGSKDWLDFFKFAAAEFAKVEKRPAGACVDGVDTLAELQRLTQMLNVIDRLNMYAVSVQHIVQKHDDKNEYFLLQLANDAKQVTVTRYKTAQFELATQRYLQLEKDARVDGTYDVVLVAASSMHALHKAYPNYFADSKDFLKYVERVLAN